MKSLRTIAFTTASLAALFTAACSQAGTPAETAPMADEAATDAPDVKPVHVFLAGFPRLDERW